MVRSSAYPPSSNHYDPYYTTIMSTLQNILEYLRPIQTHLVDERPIRHILTDSRKLTSPSDSLFFAMRTASGDGHKYIPQLYEHGVRAFFICEPIEPYVERYPDANIVQVQETLRALQQIASHWRMRYNYPVIGITGSNGKTVVKEFLYHLLSGCYRIVRSPKSYNSQLGVPLSILNMEEEHTLAIFEAGISMPMEMLRLQRIIRPTLGILTNIGAAHQENFVSLNQKIEEKLQLFVDADHFVYDADSDEIQRGIDNLGLSDKAIGWSLTPGKAYYHVSYSHSGDGATTITAQHADESSTVTIPFADQASIQNATHCLCLIGLLPLTTAQRQAVLARFATLEAIEMRLEVKEGQAGNRLINDAYNNDINSLRIALDFQKQRTATSHQQAVIILSDILQSAQLPRDLYKQVGEMIAQYPHTLFIGVGRELCNYQDYFQGSGEGKTAFYETTDQLLADDLLSTITHAEILVKGARQFQFERIVQHLAKQVHETTLEIDLEALVDNLKSYKALLSPETRIIVMAKAQGYGIGAYELAKALEQQDLAALAVALADEGKELRSKGILLPIIVMNPEVEAFEVMTQSRLEPEIYNERILREFARHVERQGLSHYPVHIELDTGMHRTGFTPDRATLEHLAQTLHEVEPLIRVQSIFTHLAAADEPTMSDFTERQFALYDEGADYLTSQLSYRPLRHVQNTAGIERYNHHHYDMARLGVGLYGISATGSLTLEPVAKLRTTLLQIKTIPDGETIGYGRRGQVAPGGQIGIIPIGYADGYDRRFSCGVGSVMIHDTLCPIVGNVCMDTCMVDLTALQGKVTEGDEVIIFGVPGLQVSDLAERIGTIPYEVISKLSPRIKRTYYKS